MKSSDISARSEAARCRILSRQVAMLCMVLLVIEAAVLLAAVTVTLSGSASAAWIYLAIGALWSVWLATLLQNYRLVRCGAQSERFRYSGRMINHPGFLARGFFHLVINWSTLAATLLTVALTRAGWIHDGVVYLCIAGTVGAWTHFNLLHRRMNRMRNLMLSSSCALVLLLIAGLLLQRAG